MLTEVSGLSAAVLIRAIARRGLLIQDHPADGLLGNPEVLSGGLEIDVGLKLISHTNTSFKVRGRRPTRPIFRTARGGTEDSLLELDNSICPNNLLVQGEHALRQPAFKVPAPNANSLSLLPLIEPPVAVSRIDSSNIRH